MERFAFLHGGKQSSRLVLGRTLSQRFGGSPPKTPTNLKLFGRTHMAHGRDLTTQADIDAALERAKSEPDTLTAVAAEYDKRLDLIVLRIDNGLRLVIPRENLQ